MDPDPTLSLEIDTDDVPDRDAMAADESKPPRLGFMVVGIGASAGGLEAFTDFFDVMPPNKGIAFVLVQHLSPKRESLIAEILAKHTMMPVLQVDDGMAVEPDHVYVIRPGHTMTIKDGRLHLGESLLTSGHSRPVDDFFRSLAEEQRERAVCIILSGMGSNGTAGAQAVKVVGGICIAQDTDSAKFPSMPRSLIEANTADFILRPEEMPEVLLRYSSHEYVNGGPPPELVVRREGQLVNEILAILRACVRHDFSGYKKPTLVRRIQRRMSLAQLTSMADYARTLRQTPAEVVSLADDLMIHVTGFFRDPDVWEALRERVIVPLVAEKADHATIRVWVTACATGEEAYTLAMLLVEAAESADKQFDIKVFATDMAARMLAHARAGVFAGGIESEISPERLGRFFDKDNGMYRVKRELRELVVFAPQNVLQDPPFSKLDLATCRNLLIYLEPEVQQRVLSLVHFGLREGGTLVLGSSETVGEQTDLFEPIDKKLRIYRRTGPTRHGLVDFPIPSLPSRLPGEADLGEARVLSRASLSQMTNKVLLDAYTPPAIVVDRHGRIVYFHGATELFLDQPRGEPTREALVLSRDFVRGSVRVALHRAIDTGKMAVVKDGLMPDEATPFRVEVTAAPLERRGMHGYYLITFVHYPVIASPSIPQVTDPIDGDLTTELRNVRDELQSTIEELQTSNEEMKASNEEVTSVNEELQSTNEELETSKEELQSLNEELTTVNTQLQIKMEELERTTNDLASLLSSTDIAVIFLDTKFRIRQFTPAVRKLLELIPSDVGRPLSDLALKFTDPTLGDDVSTVLHSLMPIEKEIGSESGHWYARRVLPYRTTDNRIEGVVVTFVDITEHRNATMAVLKGEEMLRRQLEKTSDILESISDGFYVVDVLFNITYLNKRAEQMWERQREKLLGKQFWMLFPELASSELFDRHIRAMQTRQPAQFEMISPLTNRWIDVSIYPEPGGGLSCYFRDITDRKQGEEDRLALLEAEQHARSVAEAANATKDQFLANASHELRTPLSAILLWATLLKDQACDPQTRGEGMAAIEHSALAQQKLIEDLLDSTRIANGKLNLDLKLIDLGAAVTAAVQTVRPSADAKGLHIDVDIRKGVGFVLADTDRLQQVVWNLLNNAVKFTPAGGRVNVRVQRRGATIEIRVADTGEGIAADVLSDIFSRFSQADPSSTRRHGGLGLGLAISQQLIALHGGTISAASDGPGHGSKFTIRLPFPQQTPASVVAAEPIQSTSLAGVRIVLAEDDPSTRSVVTMILQRAGATVRAFELADEAKAALKTETPDLLLSDIGMPHKDGYAFIREVRADESPDAPHLPALAFTAFDRPQDQARALGSGFNAVLTKPVDPHRLIAVLGELLAK